MMSMRCTSPYRIICTSDLLRCARCRQDLLAENPSASTWPPHADCGAVKASGRFVRCSSEFPFAPVRSGRFSTFNRRVGPCARGAGWFLHSSDLDPTKAANWKRQSTTCGEIGVMGDLGLHTVHIPFRSAGNRSACLRSCKRVIPNAPTDRAANPLAIHGTMQP